MIALDHKTVFGMTLGPIGSGPDVVVADLRWYLDDICFYTGRCDHREDGDIRTLQNVKVFNQYFRSYCLVGRCKKRYRMRRYKGRKWARQ